MLPLIERAVALRAAPVFASVPPSALLPVAELTTEARIEEGETLFREGDAGDAMYVVTRGRLRVMRGGQVVARVGPGECIGELGALDRAPRSATVIAEEAALLLRLERDDLLDLCLDSPELVRAMIAVLADRLLKVAP
ncbi:MAG: cyclic nucleotide-binding domain-containing protein [Myxococcota bacterium]